MLESWEQLTCVVDQDVSTMDHDQSFEEYSDDWYARNMPRLRDQFRPIFVQQMKTMREHEAALRHLLDVKSRVFPADAYWLAKW